MKYSIITWDYKAITNCQQRQIQEGTDPDKVINRVYIGETSRTIRVRSAQHLNDLHRCTRNPSLEEGTSWMWDHIQMAHPWSLNGNAKDDFSFEVIKSFKDPMSRQITEAATIQMALGRGTLPKGR